jgi:AcrR family transcriptional regulator
VIEAGSSDSGRGARAARRAGGHGVARGPRHTGDLRERLLQSGERRLAERPATELSVSELCREAGVSHGAFRSLFRDRGELLGAVFDRLVARVQAEMTAAHDAEPCWVDAVRAALGALLCFLDREPGLARFLLVDSLKSDPALLARRGAVLAAVAQTLDARAPAHADGVASASFGGAAVVTAVASLLHGRLLAQGDERAALSELRGSLMGMIVMPYLGVEATRGELSRHARRDDDQTGDPRGGA